MRRVEATEEVLLALEHAVQHTDNGLQHDLDAHTKADKASRHPWLAKVVPALQKVRFEVCFCECRAEGRTAGGEGASGQLCYD